MKARRTILWGLLGLAAMGATAQETVVVCPDGNPDQCYEVLDQPQQPLMTDPTPAGLWAGGTGEVWLEWEARQVPLDPTFARPGGCARSEARARGRFAQALATGDLNQVLATYHWRGKAESQVDPIADRLAAIGTQGQWERSKVGMWSGPDGTAQQAPVFWRWVANGQSTYFASRLVDDCWFLEFSSAPGDSVIVDVPPGEGGETLPRRAEPRSTQADPIPDIITF